MSRPTAQEQLKFLTNLQRLLAEGQFVATYKYALLLALADIAVESGDDSGGAFTVTTRQLAEKYIQYYWRQTVPYLPRAAMSAGQILKQNTGRQAAIIRRIISARRHSDGSLIEARRRSKEWRSVVREVAETWRVMPLWKLQTVGRGQLDFLYENVGKGSSITLRPGVAYCLRQFHGLIGDLVRGDWIRHIRRHNHDLLGTTTDLSEFLFGTERAHLGAVRGILADVQAGRCFYCERPLRSNVGHVDHFIPWSRFSRYIMNYHGGGSRLNPQVA